MTHFERHFDLDSMLNEDTSWLTMQVDLPLKEFMEIVTKLDLRQKDWDNFWKTTQTRQNIYDCVVLGKSWELNRQEFEFVNQLLGEPKEQKSFGKTFYIWEDKNE